MPGYAGGLLSGGARDGRARDAMVHDGAASCRSRSPTGTWRRELVRPRRAICRGELCAPRGRRRRHPAFGGRGLGVDRHTRFPERATGSYERGSRSPAMGSPSGARRSGSADRPSHMGLVARRRKESRPRPMTGSWKYLRIGCARRSTVRVGGSPPRTGPECAWKTDSSEGGRQGPELRRRPDGRVRTTVPDRRRTLDDPRDEGWAIGRSRSATASRPGSSRPVDAGLVGEMDRTHRDERNALVVAVPVSPHLTPIPRRRRIGRTTRRSSVLASKGLSALLGEDANDGPAVAAINAVVVAVVGGIGSCWRGASR